MHAVLHNATIKLFSQKQHAILMATYTARRVYAYRHSSYNKKYGLFFRKSLLPEAGMAIPPVTKPAVDDVR